MQVLHLQKSAHHLKWRMPGHPGKTGHSLIALGLLLGMLVLPGCLGPFKPADAVSRMEKLQQRQQEQSQAGSTWDQKEMRPNTPALAKILIRKGFYEIALDLLNEEPQPEAHQQPEIFHLKGICYRELKDYDHAMQNFMAALELAPEFAPAYNGMGITCQRMGEDKTAMASFRHAIALNPARADFYNNLGYAQIKAGRLEDAERNFRQALALKPDFSLARNNLAISIGLQGRDLEALEMMMKIFSPSVACRNMAAIYEARGEQSKAREMMDKARHPFQNGVQ
jgi:tetratricopeptide (TPR) repeat protein